MLALADDREQMQHSNETWRHFNVGRVLNNAVRRFEERVLQILEESGNTPARLSHIGLTRNLDVGGTRITELARRAAMTKQAMAQLVTQCEEFGIVLRDPDPSDGRAKIIRFTPSGLEWLEGFHQAVTQAEQEMRSELGSLRVDELTNALTEYGASADPLN